MGDIQVCCIWVELEKERVWEQVQAVMYSTLPVGQISPVDLRVLEISMVEKDVI